MKLLITTEYRENYGTPEQPYWKNKFGSEYVVNNVTLNGCEVEEVEEVISFIEWNNEASTNTVIDWEVFGDDEELPISPYTSPIIYEKVDGAWTAKRSTTNDDHQYRLEIDRVDESWDVDGKGNLYNYKVVYTMRNGEVVYGQKALWEWYGEEAA